MTGQEGQVDPLRQSLRSDPSQSSPDSEFLSAHSEAQLVPYFSSSLLISPGIHLHAAPSSLPPRPSSPLSCFSAFLNPPIHAFRLSSFMQALPATAGLTDPLCLDLFIWHIVYYNTEEETQFLSSYRFEFIMLFKTPGLQVA